MKNRQNLQELASGAVRWQEDKYLRQHQLIWFEKGHDLGKEKI